MSALISTWLKTLPLYTPTTEPIIRKDDHVAQVRLDALRLLAGGGVAVLLGGTKTLEQRVLLALEAVLEAAAGTSVHEIHELGHLHDQEVLEVNSAVGVLAECLSFGCCRIRHVLLDYARLPC